MWGQTVLSVFSLIPHKLQTAVSIFLMSGRILVQMAAVHVSARTTKLPRLCGADIPTQPGRNLYLGTVTLAEDEFWQHRLHWHRMK